MDRYIGGGNLTFVQLVNLFKNKVMPSGSILLKDGKQQYPYPPMSRSYEETRHQQQFRHFLDALRREKEQDQIEWTDDDWNDLCGND